MIELRIQIQSLIYACVYGMCFGVVWSFLNRILYFLHRNIVRLLLEVMICAGLAIVFFWGLLNINGAKINQYIIICLLLGLYLFERYYAVHFLTLYEWLMKKVKNFIKPIYFYFKKKFAIIRKWKEVIKKWIKKKVRRKLKSDLKES